MDNRTYTKNVSRVQGILDHICRERENEARNTGLLLWYNLTGDDRFRIHVPEASSLEEIYHLRILPDTDHLKEDEIDILVFIDRASEMISIHTIGLVLSTVDSWQDFTLDYVDSNLLKDVMSEILFPILEGTD